MSVYKDSGSVPGFNETHGLAEDDDESGDPHFVDNGEPGGGEDDD